MTPSFARMQIRHLRGQFLLASYVVLLLFWLVDDSFGRFSSFFSQYFKIGRAAKSIMCVRSAQVVLANSSRARLCLDRANAPEMR